MRPHWEEDKTERPPHIVWRLLDENGLEVAHFFVEKIGENYLLDKQDIEERKKQLEEENL